MPWDLLLCCFLAAFCGALFGEGISSFWQASRTERQRKITCWQSPRVVGVLYHGDGLQEGFCFSTAVSAVQFWMTGWNQFGMTGVFFSVPGYDWCAPLWHPSFHMLVNHWPSQQSSNKNTSHGNEVLLQDTTHLIQRPCYQWGTPMPRSSRQLDLRKTSWRL